MKDKKYISGLEVPEGYFNSFEERLFIKIGEEKFPKSGGFKVPKGYFKALDDRILSTVTTSNRPTKTIQLFPRKYFGYAAAVAACLFIGLLVFNYSNNSVSSLDNIQLTTIDNYIEEGNLNLDIYEVTDYISDEDISALTIKNQQFSQSVLKSYLLENIDDETILKEDE